MITEVIQCLSEVRRILRIQTFRLRSVSMWNHGMKFGYVGRIRETQSVGDWVCGDFVYLL